MLDQPPRAHWNVLLSPISLVSTLAALVAGSEGPTQEDLCRLLNLQLPEVEAIIEQFKSPDQPYVRAINEWCSNATNGKLPAVVSRKTFAPNTSMVLVGAVFFKGLWREKFSPNATHMMQFHVTRADTMDVHMMTRSGRFPYAEVPR
ncbi:hypothetical protein V5799_007038 [Amblyomma americanum]|uniref:Serpin domain-containing protein n=1 Tax=Amblyomma americanum TaxID=6943 RepID=A0AAQ4DUP1_AMBAM